jgi:peptide subunit release factor 1 (eRF1)
VEEFHPCLSRYVSVTHLHGVHRLSVLGAITSTQQKLKLYTRVPDNGLVLYCGTILTDDGKEKRVNIDFEPFKPINTSLYLCDNKFHTEVRVIVMLMLNPT